MQQKLLSNPYVVTWAYTYEKWEELKPWVLENILGRFQFIGTGRDAMVVELGQSGNLAGISMNNEAGGFWKENGELVAIALFESPKDALLFKLTWV